MPALSAGDTVVVTGGTGFVGRALCAQLASRGLRVRALARRPARGPWDELVIADVAHDLPGGVLDGAACVFHVAGYAHARTRGGDAAATHARVNDRGTGVVLAAALAARVRSFVLASSVKAMGEGGEAALDESAACRPETDYGRAKRAAELRVLAAHGDGLDASVLRLPLVYGPGVGGNLARLLRAVRGGRLPALRLPPNARSMVDVRDAAAALVLLAESPAAGGRVWLVTDGEDYSTGRVLDAMYAALGRRPPRVAVPWPVLRALAICGDGLGALLGRRMPLDSGALDALAGSARYDASRIRRELGFAPRWTLERALPGMCGDAP